MATGKETRNDTPPTPWIDRINNRIVNQINKATSFLEQLPEQKRRVIRTVLALLLVGAVGLPVARGYLNAEYKNYQKELLAARAPFGTSAVKESPESNYSRLGEDRLDFLGRFIFMDYSMGMDIEYDPGAFSAFIGADNKFPGEKGYFLIIFKDKYPSNLKGSDEENKKELKKRVIGQGLGNIKVTRIRTLYLESTITELEGPADLKKLSKAEQEAWIQILGIGISLDVAATMRFPEVYEKLDSPEHSPQVRAFKDELWGKMTRGEVTQMIKIKPK